MGRSIPHPRTVTAAIGIGIDIKQPKGNMIVDIGGGTTEITVIALSNCLRQICKNCRRRFHNDIVYYMRRQHNLDRRTHCRKD